MKWQPRIAYNNGGVVTINLSIPQRWWEPEEGVGMGDEDVSAAGVPISYVVRYDHAVNVTLRFTDAERASVMAWIEWAMRNRGTAFTFRLDQNDAATEYSVYLEAPKLEDRVRPSRDSSAPWVWELDVTLRSSTGTRIHASLPLT